jgi:hypothetical protein
VAEAYPAFDEAVSSFQEFLASQGWPRSIRWLRTGDARVSRGHIAIRAGTRARGEAHARQVYSTAVSAGMGVKIEALCRSDAHTFARIVRPLNEESSARGLFPDGLKLSVPAVPLTAVVAHRLIWPLLAAGAVWPPDDPDIDA